jgi:hypothetical protein
MGEYLFPVRGPELIKNRRADQKNGNKGYRDDGDEHLPGQGSIIRLLFGWIRHVIIPYPEDL